MKLLIQARAFLLRDLQTELSYKANLAFSLTGGFAMLMTFFFIGLTVGRSPLLDRYGGNYFAFAIVGLAAVGPLHAALMELARRVREAQVSGTLEAVLATPIGAGRAVVLSALWPMLFSCVRMAGLLGGGAILFGLPLRAAGLPAAAATLVLALAGYLALGLLSAAFTLRFKRGDPLAYMLDMISVLLGGVFYPVEVLPPPLRATAALLPATHVLEALRLSLLQGAPLEAVLPQLRALALFTAAVAPLAWLAFRLAVRRAKADGTLTHF